MEKSFYIYILTNKKRGTLYIGITNDLEKRMHEHRHNPRGFCKKYNLDKLVYIERYDTAEEAIKREKQLKHWNRQWKIELIENQNPVWGDYSTSV